MAKFKIGDRVRVTKETYGCIVGEEGTVISYEDDFGIGVRFDRFSSGKHTCYGDCEKGYGWYVEAEDIELISENKFSIGDTVKIVSKGLKGNSYDKTIGKIGVIDRTCTNKTGSLAYGVKFSDCTNPQSQYDCFWFEENCLERFVSKENNMRFIRDMQVEVAEVYEVNKKNNTKDKYMITTVSTPLGKASVKCADKDYNKDEGVYLACAKITAQMSEENMMMWHIAMDTWGSTVSTSIINRFADKACMGSFNKAYRDYLKGKNLEYKKSCICKTCGTKFETPELAREHEKWHVDHKREKYEAYLIRKEAKKRIAEAERDGKIESLIAEIVKKGAENKES